MVGHIMLQIAIIFVIALFSAAESAVVSVSPSRIEKLAEEGSKKAKRLRRIINEEQSSLSAIRAAMLIGGYIASAFTADVFADKLSESAGSVSTIPDGILNALALVAAALILAYITLVFGVIVPRRAAMRSPEKTALHLVRIIDPARVLFAPAVWLVNAASNGILRLMGIDPKAIEDTVTEEEIIMMSDAGAEKGTIDEDESRIIKNVFAFDDMTAEQVCTHRTDVSILWSEDPVEVWEETIHRTRHSQFPICGESVDNVIGILNAKDYFRLEEKSRENIMENAVREPYFVHENMKADRLFAQMKKHGSCNFAVVVDEYGGMSGIITVTDLVEQLVGDFDDDELDEPEAEFRQIDPSTWMIPGITDLDDVAEELDIPLPEEKYDTFGGYVIAALGEIPKDGTRTFIDIDRLHVEILEIHHHRIELCRVTVKPAENEDDNDD